MKICTGLHLGVLRVGHGVLLRCRLVLKFLVQAYVSACLGQEFEAIGHHDVSAKIPNPADPGAQLEHIPCLRQSSRLAHE